MLYCNWYFLFELYLINNIDFEEVIEIINNLVDDFYNNFGYFSVYMLKNLFF